MKNMFVSAHSVMDFEFWNDNFVEMHIHQNPEMFLLLKGKGNLTVDGTEIPMHEGDYYVINANRRHGFSSGTEVLYVSLHINFFLLSRMADMNQIVFRCSSGDIREETDQRIRRNIRHILNRYFSKTGTGQIKLNSYYYDLLDVLVNDCAGGQSDEKFFNRKQTDQSRLNEIVNYVYTNYKNDVSLKELANRMYLTDTYLSRYIKAHLGMNLTEYVNNVRLYYAAEELENTDKNITQIASDNGFSGLASFNKKFRQIYHMTPSEYREQRNLETGEKNQNLPHSDEIEDKIRFFLEDNEYASHLEQQEEKYVFADTFQQKYFDRYWNRMMNFGEMSGLLMADAQNQILELKRELGIEYIRLWDIYADELFLNITERNGCYNFTKMDQVFDFLVKNQMHPYIELGFKPDRLIEKLDGYIRERDREILFRTREEYHNFLSAMLGHYINRYGLKEVEKWYFEQWKDNRLISGDYDYSDWFEVFETSYRTVKSFSTNIKVGGGSLHHTYDEVIYETFLQQWKNRIIQPDFLSVYSYPYHVAMSENAVDRRRSRNPDYLSDQLREIKNILSRYRGEVKEIHVTEWNSSVSNRNYMNDSCYKGAYVVRNIINNIGNADILGYWLASDLFSQEKDSKCILNGGVGLLSRNGIRKPAFYAYKFLSGLGEYVIGQDENSFITSGGGDEYYIILHNCRQPGYRYFTTAENAVDIKNQEQYFESWNKLKENIHIAHVKNGKYKIKIQRVNMNNGSIMNEWILLGQTGDLTPEELGYLEKISIPQLEVCEQDVKEETLNFETILEPNEIQYIRMSYQFS